MKRFKILLLGNGAREHAIAWKLTKSKYLEHLYCIGFNVGFSNNNKITILPFNYSDNNHIIIIDFCKNNIIDFVIIGNETPIFAGLSDDLVKNNIKVLAPNSVAAKLESSKIYAKNFMHKNNIPTANYKIFDNAKAAILYCKKYFATYNQALVIKADGAALGKGVVIVNNLLQAKHAINFIITNYGHNIIIEDFLCGSELSLFILCDGKNYKFLGFAKDYKTIFDNNKGENTGGMGAYSANDLLNKTQLHFIKKNIIEPTLQGLKNLNITYSGVLYFGLKLTQNKAKLLEYNVRFGDPEAQVILPRLKNDLLKLFIATINKNLKNTKISWRKQQAISVVLANKGYPQTYQKNLELDLNQIQNYSDIIIFYANILPSTKNNIYLTDGGRLLNIVVLHINKKLLIATIYNAITF